MAVPVETDSRKRVWRRSSYTYANGNCVEVAAGGSEVDVRDSKNRNGGKIYTSRKAWEEFTAKIKNGWSPKQGPR